MYIRKFDALKHMLSLILKKIVVSEITRHRCPTIPDQCPKLDVLTYRKQIDFSNIQIQVVQPK